MLANDTGASFYHNIKLLVTFLMSIVTTRSQSQEVFRPNQMVGLPQISPEKAKWLLEPRMCLHRRQRRRHLLEPPPFFIPIKYSIVEEQNFL